MNQVNLVCISDGDAMFVLDQIHGMLGGGEHRRVDNVVVIQYYDRNLPKDIAHWALNRGYVTPASAARTLAKL